MADVLRVSLLGTLPGGEVWSVNPVWGVADFGAPIDFELANTIAVACAAVAVPAAITQMWSSSTRLTSVRVEARSYAGVLESQAEAAKGSPAVGTAAQGAPIQTSLVSSLRTAVAGGRGRGRLYWPATGLLIGPVDLRPPAANVTAILAAVKTYLSGLETAIKVSVSTAKLVVWSRESAAAANVNRIFLGDIPDVQRRRRDALAETLQIVSFP